MKVQVKVFANLREICNASVVEVETASLVVIDILEELVKMFPAMEDEIFTEERTLKSFVHVFINGHNIIHKDGLLTKINPDDQFALFPPVAGG
ncbi:MoaD/ThiS family protein [Schinkia azotoformans]|uniref:MoaD family protein n=1 Tax=Schinkia azotoformans LMG 9581 TaxID=1131731 RepID=K6CB91_SCHAZ|nr:ubiquitin-like small modifier protein 1 [Schinkia azotoformans]EKN68400.1 MoaD family protein [Schinkia azotoformans LMG 9581]MEC1638487.1 MoaD/ThiS family protein [Schinkia azotoformans]MEC1721344.1 MoaD/ThiS family protein [Schinkia azotoformans]MEC1946079.1 MoaD/ThiS family protein [Schinkia azotoformans]MED4351581.1 MoaD/ThiS family protein [Schinkia azotoformans]